MEDAYEKQFAKFKQDWQKHHLQGASHLSQYIVQALSDVTDENALEVVQKLQFALEDLGKCMQACV